MPLQTGQILNQRYRIDRLLGQGGFGAVYLAWDLNLQAQVALKESLSSSPLAEKQFRREANLLFRLRHPNLPIVHDCFSTPGRVLYLTMDYIEGESLERKLARQRVLPGGAAPLPVAQALAWIVPICDALDYLHRQSPPVIHRDIKPANIIIRRDRLADADGAPDEAGAVAGTPFLVDFGISKLFDPERKTTQGAQAFTPGYSPPEQYGSSATDARSDIYALGATLYHLLTGQAPPQAVDILTGTEPSPWPPQALNPAVPPALGQAVMRAMQLERAQRWGTAGELRRALLAAAPPGGAPAEGLGPVIFQSAGGGPPAGVAAGPAAAPPPATAPLGAERATGANLVQVAPRPAARPGKRPGLRKNGQTALLGVLGGLVFVGMVVVALLLGWLAGRRTPATPTAAALLTGGSQTPEAAALVATAVAHGGTATALARTVPSATLTATPSPTSSPTPSLTATATSTNIPPATASSGDTWFRPADGMPMRYVPAGEFQMGSNDKDPNAQDDEQPRRTVALDAYWIDQTEVTNAMFRHFADATGYVTQAEKQQNGQIFDPRRSAWRAARSASWRQPAGDQSSLDGLDAYPVVLVSWEDAVRYCQWTGGRLPTEAEWEKAARGTEGRIYPWGDDFKGDRLNFCDTNCLAEKANENRDDGYEMLSPVGAYPGGASPFGVLDLSGNAWEWVLDWYQNRYTGLAGSNPFGPQAGSEHVARGGSWADTYIETRAAYRTSFAPETAIDTLGFRCVR